jgi:hypothetical protein
MMKIPQPNDDDDESACETRIINVQNRRVKPGLIRANTEQRSSVTNTVARPSSAPPMNHSPTSKPSVWAWLKKLFRG